MDAEIVSRAAVQLALMALTGVAGWLGGKLKGAAKERRDAAERESRERDEGRAVMRLLLYYRLKDLFDAYVVEGRPVTSADKHEIEEAYRYYHDSLGGNGEGTRMYSEMMGLKTSG